MYGLFLPASTSSPRFVNSLAGFAGRLALGRCAAAPDTLDGRPCSGLGGTPAAPRLGFCGLPSPALAGALGLPAGLLGRRRLARGGRRRGRGFFCLAEEPGDCRRDPILSRPAVSRPGEGMSSFI